LLVDTHLDIHLYADTLGGAHKKVNLAFGFLFGQHPRIIFHKYLRKI